MPVPVPIPVTLTANLSGTVTNPVISLVASGDNAGLWDVTNQKLDLSGLPKAPPPRVDVTIKIGTSTIPGTPPVNFPSTNPNEGITIKYKNNPNVDPPPGLFHDLLVSSDRQTLSFQDKNGDHGDYSFTVYFAIGPNGTVIHDPEIQNTGGLGGTGPKGR